MSNLAISIPPLASGDRLTREEFERRYDAMPRLKKAELIEGIVYMASSLRFESHAEPHAFIITWLGIYYVSTPGVRLADNASVRLDMNNEAQPDALLRLPKSVGGRSQVTQDDYLEG
ncbi:MAG: Uma2 family endonuclease, partial [Gammaproteobacteria bacterium]|nr:Uma2 family endonuclease [Gammaproteobacteria bacterium]